MHYSPDHHDHGLPYDPLKSLVVPRPIGWISTVDERGGVNLAPYSFFNLIADRPAYVMFASDGRKDSLRNVEVTGEFVCNLVTEELYEQMMATAAPFPHGQSEPERLGIDMRPSIRVNPPTVAAARASLECVHYRTVNLPGANDDQLSPYQVVIGRVVSVSVDDAALDPKGYVRPDLLRPVARLGYQHYAIIENTFAHPLPKAPDHPEATS
ncbi:MAG: flavin reductase family protein [Mycobacteriaceae bacterium]|nr:flavin reductase family protein [Mycobacteriaceae bacterium]